MSDALNYLVKARPEAMTAYFTFLKKADTHLDTRTEYYCTVRALRALDRCDVAVQVIDTSQPFSRQDYRISGAVAESQRPAVLVFYRGAD